MTPGRPEPPHLAIDAPDAALKVPVGPRRCVLAEVSLHIGTVLGQNVFQEHLERPRGQQRLIAKDAVVGQRASRGVIPQVHLPDSCIDGLQGEVQPRLALLQRLGPAALGVRLCLKRSNPASKRFVFPDQWVGLSCGAHSPSLRH